MVGDPAVDMRLLERLKIGAEPDGGKAGAFHCDRSDLGHIRIADETARHYAFVGGHVSALERPRAERVQRLGAVLGRGVPQKERERRVAYRARPDRAESRGLNSLPRWPRN